jgi:signal transduction histidine kinase
MLSSSDRPSVRRLSSEPSLDYSQEHLWDDVFNHLGVAIAQLTLGGTFDRFERRKTRWKNRLRQMIVSLMREDITGVPRNLIAAATDITALKQERQDAVSARDELNHRMTNAQEADRTRIARELHDDIGQSLAVLKIQM